MRRGAGAPAPVSVRRWCSSSAAFWSSLPRVPMAGVFVAPSSGTCFILRSGELYVSLARVRRATLCFFGNVRPWGAHGVCIFEHVAEARREERSKRRELRRLAVLSFLSSLPQGMSVDARWNEWRRSLAGVGPLFRLCLLAVHVGG